MKSVGSSRNNLILENQRLKQRVAELEAQSSPLSANPDTGEIRVDQFSVGGMEIEKLRVRALGLREATERVGDIRAWAKGRPDLGPLAELAQRPLIVDELRARVPLPLVNSLMDQIAGDQLKEAGLSEVRLSQGEGRQVRVRGTLKKGLSLPFEVNGNLAASSDGGVKFSLQSSRLGGVPMPNLLLSLATKLAGESLEKAGVSVQGDDFTIDTKRLTPKNVSFELSELSVDNGALVLEGSAEQRKSSVPLIPRKGKGSARG